MPSAKHSLDLTNVSPTEIPETRKNKPKKYSIYQIVSMKIFFIKSKNRKSAKLAKSAKSAKSASEKQIRASLEFVFTVTDFDKEQVTKAKSYIKSSKFSEALSILEPISKHPLTTDYDVLFWIGHCHENLKNYELADQYYKECADYLLDDGYWETAYGKFLLEHSNLGKNSKEERIEEGVSRLKSAADQKRYVVAMYILGKIYINGLYDVKQDFNKGEIYLKRAYNGGERNRSWAVFEKKAKELIANGKLSKVPLEHVWAKH